MGALGTPARQVFLLCARYCGAGWPSATGFHATRSFLSRWTLQSDNFSTYALVLVALGAPERQLFHLHARSCRARRSSATAFPASPSFLSRWALQSDRFSCYALIFVALATPERQLFLLHAHSCRARRSS